MNQSNKMTAQEIIKKIEEAGISVSDFADGDFGCPDNFLLPEELESQRKAYKAFSALPYDEKKGKDWPKYDIDKANAYWLEQTGIGPWKEVDSYGGEDQGSTWYSIKYFSNHDVYIRTDGYYQSHYGTDFDEGYGVEVKPKEKTITVYEQVK